MSKALPTLKPQAATPESAAVLNAVQSKMGFIPNLMGALANNAEALKAYLGLDEHFSKSGLSPLEQQVIALTVSGENSCGYCIAAHSAISAMGKLDEKTIQRVREGEKLEDPRLEALRTFTKRVTTTRGVLDPSDVEAFLAVGYQPSHVAAVLIGVTMKTLSNYTNHIAKTELDAPFQPFALKSKRI